MRLAKTSQVAEEIFESFLNKMAAEPDETSQPITSALEFLDNAAALFEDIGMDKEAEVVTRIMEKIAQS